MKKVFILLVFLLFLQLFLFTFNKIRAIDQPVLSGGAVQDGVVTLVSNINTRYSSVSIPIPVGTRFDNILNLSALYDVTTTNCGFGSPSFQLFLQGSSGSISTVVVKIGSPPSFNNCPSGWTDTGNLAIDQVLRVDATAVGGLYDDTFVHAQAVAGNSEVIGINFVVDGNFGTDSFNQIINLRQLKLGTSVYNFDPIVPTMTPIPTPTTVPCVGPTDKDQCKKDGWKIFTCPVFKNQGDCVSFVVPVKK
jgi:hypothetical protein